MWGSEPGWRLPEDVGHESVALLDVAPNSRRPDLVVEEAACVASKFFVEVRVLDSPVIQELGAILGEGAVDVGRTFQERARDRVRRLDAKPPQSIMNSRDDCGVMRCIAVE